MLQDFVRMPISALLFVTNRNCNNCRRPISRDSTTRAFGFIFVRNNGGVPTATQTCRKVKNMSIWGSFFARNNGGVPLLRHVGKSTISKAAGYKCFVTKRLDIGLILQHNCDKYQPHRYSRRRGNFCKKWPSMGWCVCGRIRLKLRDRVRGTV